MSTAKLQKYVNLALNNSSEGEASTAARMFFKKLRSLDMRFNSKSWGLTGEQARKLMELGGVQIKGAKLKTEPKETTPGGNDPKATEGSNTVFDDVKTEPVVKGDSGQDIKDFDEDENNK